MRRCQPPIRPFKAALAALVLTLSVGAAEGNTAPVRLGKIEAAPVAESTLEPVLRAAFEEELRSADLAAARLAKRYVLSAALVKLESATHEKMIKSTCVISVTLRTQQDVLVAIIQGRATAEVSSTRDAARAAALRGAVRSAVKKVPSALRATERRG